MKIVSEEGKDFLAALREEEDDVDARAKKTTTTTTPTTSTATVALAATKKHKRMAVLNNQPSLEVDSDSDGKFVINVGGSKSRVFFPIFSKGQKTVHLVRHGQSTYNVL